MSPLERARVGWSERLEPVLVKDLRAALRGKAFALTLLGSVSLTTAVLLFVLVLRTVDGAEPEGERLFEWVAWSANAAMGVFVPLWAFTSLGQELDGDAYDLLAISRLSAWRIVWGKFLAAMAQCALVFCAAFPFALFAFLLGGIDAGTVAVRMLGVLATSAICVAAALAASALARTKWVRAMLLAGVAFALLWMHGALFVGAARGGRATMYAGAVAPESLARIAGQLAIAGSFAGFFLALAAACLAHPESSRSTPVRAWLFVLAIAHYASAPFALWTSGLATMLGYASFFFMPLAVVVLLFVCTEREPLPRALAWRPRTKLAALFASPFLAGGGRGAVFTLLFVVVLVIGTRVVFSVLPSAATGLWRASLLACVSIPCVYVLLPSGLLARWNTDASRPRTIRAVIAFAWGVLWVGTALLLAATGGRLDPMLLFYGPIVNTDGMFAPDGWVRRPLQLLAIAALSLAAVLVNLPRKIRGVREVLARVEPEREPARVKVPGAIDAPPQP